MACSNWHEILRGCQVFVVGVVATDATVAVDCTTLNLRFSWSEVVNLHTCQKTSHN
mgnify:CR=1 FL=1